MKSDREKQKEHGAQSDQGRQRMQGNEPKRDVYEGPEESNQQRRYE